MCAQERERPSERERERKKQQGLLRSYNRVNLGPEQSILLWAGMSKRGCASLRSNGDLLAFIFLLFYADRIDQYLEDID